MKATFEFNLPEEREEYETYAKARQYYSILWDVQEQVRKHVKYDQDLKLTFALIKEVMLDFE